MKDVVGAKKGLGVALVLLMVAMMVAPEMAMAGGNVNTLLSNVNFLKIIKFGLGMYAAWKWFDYFHGFNPSSAFKDIIVPAIITFLAFEIGTVLGWFGFGSL